MSSGTTAPGDDSNPRPDALRLDQFLKLSAVAGTGGQAKLMIQNGEVSVNGEIETRRRRKLSIGDIVEVGGTRLLVNEAPSTD